MSRLLNNNKLKLEVKSSDADIAKFISTENAEIVFAPDNKNNPNQHVVIGSRIEDESSNLFKINTYIGTNENNNIASFNVTNTDLTTTTIIRGNLIIEGSALSLGTAIMNDETDDVFSNIPKSAYSNLISERYSSLLISNILDTSNFITDILNHTYNMLYSNVMTTYTLENLFEGINFQVFSDADFDNLLAEKTLNDLANGNINKYIHNKTYPNDLIINTDLIASNFSTETINANEIHAAKLYGDGSKLTNLYKGDGTTSTIIEGSNLYYKTERVIPIITASNMDASNYAFTLFETIIEKNDVSHMNISNLILDTSNTMINILHQDFADMSNLNDIYALYSFLNECNLNISNLSSNFNILFTEKVDTYVIDINNYIAYSSNILYNLLYENIQISSNYILNLYQFNNDLSSSSNAFVNNIYDGSNAFVSNMNENMYNLLAYIEQGSNMMIDSLTSNAIDNSNYITYTFENLSNYLIMNIDNAIYNADLTSNDLNYFIDYKSSILTDVIIEASNVLINIIDSNVYNLSNYIDYNNIYYSNLIINNYDISSNTIQDVSNYIITEATIFLSNIDISTNYTSNAIFQMVDEIHSNINKQTDATIEDLSADIYNISNLYVNTINALTCDDIIEGDNKFFTSELFYSNIRGLTLDNINNGTSNKYIYDGKYEGNLTISCNLYASNLKVIGTDTILFTNSINRDYLEILSTDYDTALTITQMHPTCNILEAYDYEKRMIFNVKQNGIDIGIKPNNEVNYVGQEFIVNVYGTTKADNFIGSGALLSNVNLSDKTTSELTEGSNGSNLYFTIERVSAIIDASNLHISNYVFNMSNMIVKSQDNFISNENKYWTNTSNNVVNYISLLNTSQSNFITSTSNELMKKAYAILINSNQSNYLLNTSNTLIKISSNYSLQLSNYVLSTSNALSNIMVREAINNSNYLVWYSNTTAISIANNNKNMSNYIANTSNSLFKSYIVLEGQQSNYTLLTSNSIINMMNTYRINTSNLIFGISNINASEIRTSIINTSNYVKYSSNYVVARISELITNTVLGQGQQVQQSINRWQEPTTYVTTSTVNTNSMNYIVYRDGNVGIGTSYPTATLDIYTVNPASNSIKVNNDIWAQTGVVYSSDARIKKDIVDIDDGDALNKIMSIKPKLYDYIDNQRHKNKKDVYGFIAQQIAEVIPNAISLQTEAVPNIYCSGTLFNNILMFNKDIFDIDNLLNEGTKIAVLYNQSKYIMSIVEIYSHNVYKIDNMFNISGSVFIYGIIVEDFHTLDKDYIYTLNVCATQDLHRRQLQIADNIRSIKTNYNLDKIEKIQYNVSNIIENMSFINKNSNLMIAKYDDFNKEFAKINELNTYYTNIISSNMDLQNMSHRIQVVKNENSNIRVLNEQMTSNNSILRMKVQILTSKISNIRDILQRNNII
jgi:hypothetical protein